MMLVTHTLGYWMKYDARYPDPWLLMITVFIYQHSEFSFKTMRLHNDKLVRCRVVLTDNK